MNRLYFGDNLRVLREHVADQSVDLVYLDPPFNSNASYGLLFKDGKGAASEAQAEAFRDSWSWGQSAEEAVDDIMKGGGDLALLTKGMRSWLGDCGLMAYVVMMAVRLIELKRVLKPTGSLYLHCDPTASHYLKIVLDAIFGGENFRNEVIWQRSTGKSLMTTRLPTNHDVILAYQMGNGATWNADAMFSAYDPDDLPASVMSKYSNCDPDGRRYTLGDLLNPNRNRPNLTYEFLGMTRVWRWTKERMQRAYDEGLVVQTGPGRVPRFKRYLDQQRGLPFGDVWTDIPPLNSQAQERLGYPTQKPLTLLDRILKLATRPGNVVLDPFCGCGTTVEAAEQLGRNWIGIDVTHYAVTLIEQRLKKSHPQAKYDIHGRPTDLEGAIELARRDKHQFQWWGCWLLGAQSYRETKKGADRGIDGRVFFHNGPFGHGEIIISVKGGENVSVTAIRDLRGVIEREGAEIGILVTLAEPTAPMVAEAAAAGFVQKSAHGRIPRIQIATVADLLEGRRPILPPLPQPVPIVRRQPKTKKLSDQMELLLPFSGPGKAIQKGDFIDPAWMPLAQEK